MEADWKRVAAAAAVVLVALVAAKLLDRALIRRLKLPPEAMTRYRVLRRSLIAGIVLIGVLSALLVIPEVRAAAGGVLASSAVVALIVGMAARSTLSNFVAGMMLAFTQPLRLGDEVTVGDAAGTVEEIALTYTTIRTPSGERFFVPNEKLASDTIRNATIASSEHLAKVRIPVPLSSDLDRVLALAEEETKACAESVAGKEPVARVSDFDTTTSLAVVTVEAWAPPGRVPVLEADIRRTVHKRLREEGIY